MIVIGLTGSIGMGKSTAAEMLRTLGVPVHCSDDAVHALFADTKGQAYTAICAAFPYFEYPQIYKNREIDRKALGKVVFGNDEARKKLENILHPLVRQSQDHFIRTQQKAGRSIVALDIPLLFETGAEQHVDVTAVVSAPYEIQRARVLARDGMDEEKFHAIVERQMSDGEKCARADYVIQTGLGRAETMQQIKTMLESIKNGR